MNLTANEVGVGGAFEINVIENNKIIKHIPIQKNLILDGFFDVNIPGYCNMVIGTGVSTPPSVTDTALGNEVKKSSNLFGGFAASGTIVTYNGEKYLKRTGSSDFTGVNGDVSEVGLRDRYSPYTLMTRSLIKDANGNVITIPIRSDQTLRLTYTTYTHIPQILGQGSFTAPDGTLTNYIIKPWGDRSSYKGILGQDTYNHSFGSTLKAIFTTSGLVNLSSVANSRTNFERTDSYKMSSSDAVGVDRPIGHLEAYGTSYKEYPKVEFTPPLVLLANHDLSVSFKFTRSRLADIPLV